MPEGDAPPEGTSTVNTLPTLVTDVGVTGSPSSSTRLISAVSPDATVPSSTELISMVTGSQAAAAGVISMRPVAGV